MPLIFRLPFQGAERSGHYFPSRFVVYYVCIAVDTRLDIPELNPLPRGAQNYCDGPPPEGINLDHNTHCVHHRG